MPAQGLSSCRRPLTSSTWASQSEQVSHEKLFPKAQGVNLCNYGQADGSGALMAFGVIIAVGCKQGSDASCLVKLSGLIKFVVLALEGGLEHQVLMILLFIILCSQL